MPCRSPSLALAAVLVILGLASPAVAARVEGRVVDAQGKGVPATVVTVSSGEKSVRVTTDRDGQWSAAWEGGDRVVLTADAPGFTALRQELRLRGAPITLFLSSEARRSEEVTVTATGRPQRLADTPASVAVLSATDLRASASLAVDDALRQVPGFTLFRRTGSRFANPTTQGASLRGLGGSGAGRAAVLDDGVSLADPFGGWVHWSRVPRASVERIEVLRGGASDLYGGGALAGVVHVVRRGTEEPHFDAELGVGPDELAEGSLSAGGRLGNWGMRLGGEIVSTGGYVAVPQAVRGPVDEPLSSVHHAADLALERHAGWGRVFLRGGSFRDQRENGTLIQDNATSIRQGVLGLDAQVRGGSLSVRGNLLTETYTQSFSAIATNRQTERRTSEQRVPSRGHGVTVQFSRALGTNHTLLAGVEQRGVWGRNEEDLYPATGTAPPTETTASGRQRMTGVFAEDVWTPSSRLILTGSLRFDRWRNYGASQTEAERRTELPSRGEQALSPRVTALWRLSSHFSLTGAGYKAFRPPTLNELYRSFRVGNALTRANATLEAERSTGYEGGALVSFPRFSLRTTRFSMGVDDTVANVTLSTTPSLITRERRNLGAIRSRGLEVETEARLTGRLTLSASWMMTRSIVTSAPADARLVSLRVPQVPRHQGSLQLRYASASGFVWGVQGRLAGAQFEDDLNQLSLKGFRVLDALVEHPITGQVLGFAAVENVGNTRVEIGRTPVLTVGPSRSFRIGVRVRITDAPPANP